MLMAAPKWPVDHAVPPRPLPRREPVAVCEAWVLARRELDGWVERAAPGEVLVYMRGPRPIHGETLERVRVLAAEGRIEQLPQRRAEGCFGYEHRISRRLDPAVAKAMAGKPDFDGASKIIFEALQRCVERGRRAYSNRELARIAGLATRAQAAWRVRKLEESGRLATSTEMTAEGPWRVVTIGKRSTARPAA